MRRFSVPIVLLLILSGCDLSPPADPVKILLPQGPPAAEGRELIWRLDWTGRNGGTVSMRTQAGKNLILHLPRELTVSIRAVPLLGLSGYRSKPAGAILPAHRMRPSMVKLTWPAGFTADLLLKLTYAGAAPEYFNSSSILQESLIRSGGDPWILNIPLLMKSLAARKLRKTSFRPLPTETVTLDLPKGAWYPESPLAVPLVSDGSWTGEIPVGIWSLTMGSEGPVKIVKVMKDRKVILWTEDSRKNE